MTAAVDTALSYLGPDEPASSPHTIRSGQVLRLLTRQLYDYPSGETVPVADAADGPPEVSENGRAYRVRLRRGIFWDAQGARELVAGDFVRGFKRVALPSARHARRYFTETIAGMREYCEAFDEKFAGQQPHAPDLAQFQFSHQVAGLSTPDAHTIVIRLAEPAPDLLNILATGVAAAAPREYDYYTPDSPELYRNNPSAGPYRVNRGLSRGAHLVLEPNPRWDPDTDPLRRRTADMIRIGPGADRYDVAWPAPLGYAVGPYLVVNLHEARRGSPVGQPAVRRALACAANRLAVRDAVIATNQIAVAVVQHGLLPPGSPGYGSALPLADDRGDPDRARRELAGAGFPDGISLVLAVGDAEIEQRAAAVLRDGLVQAGIALEIRPRAGDLDWDLTLDSHAPDWYGNNLRTAVEPIVRGGTAPGSANRSGYDNCVIHRVMSTALRDPDPDRSADLWRKVEELVLADLPIIPLLAHGTGADTAGMGAPPQIRWFTE